MCAYFSGIPYFSGISAKSIVLIHEYINIFNNNEM